MDNAIEKKQAGKDGMKLLDRTMQALVGNAYAFTVGVMCLVHSVLFIIFLANGVTPLAVYNALSVAIYILCFFLCKSGRILAVYAAIILEVTIYTVVSSYYVGLRCGTYCFLFSIIPIIIYFGSSMFKGKQRWSVIMMLVLNFVTFAVLYACFSEIQPVYIVSSFTRTFLVIFSAFAMVFATMFYNAMYIYASEHEVTILEQKNKQLSADAQEDALTSLLNRRGFVPVVKNLMKDKSKHFCVAFCDLDNFKNVNDTYGHDAGDEVLKHVTRLIKKEMQGFDICRWGGEEIVILMRNQSLDSAKAKAEKLRKNIESEPTVFFSKSIPITVTIGLAEYKDGVKEPEDVIKVADGRMYYGKQHGKNVVVFEDGQQIDN